MLPTGRRCPFPPQGSGGPVCRYGDLSEITGVAAASAVV